MLTDENSHCEWSDLDKSKDTSVDINLLVGNFVDKKIAGLKKEKFENCLINASKEIKSAPTAVIMASSVSEEKEKEWRDLMAIVHLNASGSLAPGTLNNYQAY